MRGRLRPLRDRRLVVGAVAVALALVVTIAVAPWPSGPSHPPKAQTVGDAKAAAGCADVLVVGDLNAYGAEDPIRLLEGAGFESLNKRIPAAERYSYVFEGLSGYLDHALSTANLSGQVSGVTEWHINADEPVVLDVPRPDEEVEVGGGALSDVGGGHVGQPGRHT